MAGNIQKINIAQLKSERDAYWKEGSEMHNTICDICSDLKNLTTFWTGQRINTVIDLWNQNYEKINEQVFYFFKVKLILGEIITQYESMEKGAPKDSGSGYGWGGILKVNTTDTTTIKYDKANVDKIINDIKTKTNTTFAKLKILLTKLDSLQAYSDSLKSLHTNYTNNATSIKNTLEKLIITIETEATKAASDVNVTEQYNETDAKRATTTTK